MLKQLIAYLLQAAGSVAAVVAGFVWSPVAGWTVLAVVATGHGVVLERELLATHTPARKPVAEKRGDA